MTTTVWPLSLSKIASWRIWIKAAALVTVPVALVSGAIALWEPQPIEVRVAPPLLQDIDLAVTTTGKVIPVNEFQARASFPGMIEKVFVQLGETVHTGQMLVKMKDPFAMSRVVSATAGLQTTEVGSENVHRGGSQEDLIGLQGEWKRALQEQASAENALTSIKQLQETGAASPAEVYGSQQRLQAANTTIDTLRARMTKRYSASDKASWDARVAQAKASLDAEKTSFANANITSPIDGTVFLAPVAAYDFVGIGAPLIDVADLNHVRIRAFFDEPDIGKLHIGQTVNVRWDGRPDQVWEGRVEHAPLAATAMGSRTVGECMISVDNARGQLLPNTNVNVSVPVEQKKKVLTIPREALHTDGRADYVFRVEDNKLVKTPVGVSLINLDRVEVTRGVTVKDIVALHASDNSDLKDGLKVRIVQ